MYTTKQCQFQLTSLCRSQEKIMKMNLGLYLSVFIPSAWNFRLRKTKMFICEIIRLFFFTEIIAQETSIPKLKLSVKKNNSKELCPPSQTKATYMCKLLFFYRRHFRNYAGWG